MAASRLTLTLNRSRHHVYAYHFCSDGPGAHMAYLALEFQRDETAGACRRVLAR